MYTCVPLLNSVPFFNTSVTLFLSNSAFAYFCYVIKNFQKIFKTHLKTNNTLTQANP